MPSTIAPNHSLSNPPAKNASAPTSPASPMRQSSPNVPLPRREFLRRTASAVAALSAAAQTTSAQSSSKSTALPNIVVIFADDLGWGDLACYGHPTIRTPHLDQMARDGVRFTQFYAAAPACSPSRAALLTGRLPIRTTVNQVLNPWGTTGLPATEWTIARLLKPRGYATACIGKWHLGHLPQFLPTRHGFDRYFGIPYSNDMSLATAGNPGFIAQLKQHPEVPGTPLLRDETTLETEPDQDQITRRYTQEAVAFLRHAVARKQPFFLYLPHTMPHHPLHASAQFRGKSPRGLYGDVVEELDWSVGEIRRTLKELGVEKNTLVVFTSDNGPWLVKREEGGSAGLLRDGKGTNWEGGHRVPGIVAWPGRVPAGVVSTVPASTMDLLPTIAALAGTPLPSGRVYDGEDLLPVLQGKQQRPEFTFFYYAGPQLRALRRGPWKLMMPPGKPDELYHLEIDPSEAYNRAAEKPEVVAALRALIAPHQQTLA